MNVAKLRNAKMILDGHNVDTNIPRHIAITAEQMEELLASTEIGSYDYNSVKALVQGDFSTFMGFKFVEVNGEVASTGIIPVTADPYRRVLAWAEDGIILGVGKDVKTNIEQRIDKNYSYQIFNEMWMGSMRTSEKKVVDVLCDES
jgi:hypothetical protein